jgi:mediator of RNA polymerase II transcription subunit 18
MHPGIRSGQHALINGRFVTEYYTEGHEFVNDNVVVHFYRILHEPGVRALESTPKRTLPSLDALKPFDPSGAYIVDTTLRILDLNDSVMAQAGVDEMNRFRAQLKGCVELKALERIRLDTRVKYVPKGVAMSQTRPRTQAAQG